MPCIVRGVAVVGVTGTIISVEVSLAAGLPSVGVVGLPDAAVSEARQRVRCAIENSGLSWPQGRITIGLSPAHTRKHGTSLDLPIALGVLAASGQLDLRLSERLASFGELGLDGSVRSVPGAVALTCATQRAGVDVTVVPVAQERDCARVRGVEIVGVDSLRDAVNALAEGEPSGRHRQGIRDGTESAPATTECVRGPRLDLADVLGQEEGCRTLEIAAAGRHNVLMVGPPGVGKTMLAERLPGLLPDLSADEAIEVMSLNALGATSDFIVGEDSRPPFQAPHHSSSPAALLGSVKGGEVQLGAVSLAHRGVLFLDEAPEFPRNALEALRQPLEKRVVSLHRSRWHGELPADVQLVLTANPCPCGYRTVPQQMCACPSRAVRSYGLRISGPLRDRIDLRLPLRPIASRTAGERTSVVADRVAEARSRAVRRWGVPNARVAASVMAQHPLSISAESTITEHLHRSGGLRSVHSLVRVAWSISDLAGAEKPSGQHAAEALLVHGGRMDGFA